MDYIACQLIWHSAKKRYYQVGERVPLDHLDSKAIGDLVSAGAIAPVEDAPKQKEAIRGTNSIDSARH